MLEFRKRMAEYIVDGSRFGALCLKTKSGSGTRTELHEPCQCAEDNQGIEKYRANPLSVCRLRDGGFRKQAENGDADGERGQAWTRS